MKQEIIYFLSYTRGGRGTHEGFNEGGKQPTVMPLWANVGHPTPLATRLKEKDTHLFADDTVHLFLIQIQR